MRIEPCSFCWLPQKCLHTLPLRRESARTCTIRRMWHSVFSLDVSVWEKLLRTFFLYLFLVVALRLAGKREMAQLTTMDFVVLLLVSNAVQNGLIGNDNSVTGAFIGAGALFAMNAGLVIVLFRHRRLRTLFGGSASVLVRDGQVDAREMKREHLTHTT